MDTCMYVVYMYVYIPQSLYIYVTYVCINEPNFEHKVPINSIYKVHGLSQIKQKYN